MSRVYKLYTFSFPLHASINFPSNLTHSLIRNIRRGVVYVYTWTIIQPVKFQQVNCSCDLKIDKKWTYNVFIKYASEYYYESVNLYILQYIWGSMRFTGLVKKFLNNVPKFLICFLNCDGVDILYYNSVEGFFVGPFVVFIVIWKYLP